MIDNKTVGSSFFPYYSNNLNNYSQLIRLSSSNYNDFNKKSYDILFKFGLFNLKGKVKIFCNNSYSSLAFQGT